MKKLIFLTCLSMVAAACGSSSSEKEEGTTPEYTVEETHPHHASNGKGDADHDGAIDEHTSGDETPLPADNTGVNERDSDGDSVTPIDQGESSSDLKITQDIRQAVMDADVSFSAKNIKIITVDGKVTLRGPVDSAAERATIVKAAKKVAGANRVDDQIEVAK